MIFIYISINIQVTTSHTVTLERIKEFIHTLEYENSMFIEEKKNQALEITKLQTEIREMNVSRLGVDFDMPVSGLGDDNIDGTAPTIGIYIFECMFTYDIYI
jgi:hypothetical protein